MRINYRKARKGDVACAACRYYRSLDWLDARFRGRCTFSFGTTDVAVGKRMTCDHAALPEKPAPVRSALP